MKLLRRASRYLSAFFTGRFNELADPKVQLEQAITEAQEQHRMLKEQAANVIANQKNVEMRLGNASRSLDELQKKARQALVMANEEQAKGDVGKAASFTSAAESFATRMIALENEVESLKVLHLQASQATDAAKKAVNQNSLALQQKLSDRQRLLSQLDQAKMQEQMNKAIESISGTVGDDVPTFDEVQRKIEERQARALGHAEVVSDSVEASLLEVEQAALMSETSGRLDQMRAELGLPSASELPSSKKEIAPPSE